MSRFPYQFFEDFVIRTPLFSYKKFVRCLNNEDISDLELKKIYSDIFFQEAVYLASAFGDNVGQALTINDPNESNNYPQPIMFEAMAADANQSAPMNVDFKKIKIQYDVNVVFELK